VGDYSTWDQEAIGMSRATCTYVGSVPTVGASIEVMSMIFPTQYLGPYFVADLMQTKERNIDNNGDVNPLKQQPIDCTKLLTRGRSPP
jgi:hypothetical protein